MGNTCHVWGRFSSYKTIGSLQGLLFTMAFIDKTAIFSYQEYSDCHEPELGNPVKWRSLACNYSILFVQIQNWELGSETNFPEEIDTAMLTPIEKE